MLIQNHIKGNNDLTGMTFGMLSVLSKAENIGRNTAWECKCECGKVKSILTYNLLGNKSKSCGCIRGKKLGNFSTTHGESKTRLYGIYKGINQRCNNKNTPAYKYYGARNIAMCDDWQNDFLNFKKWSLENGYDDTNSIDRINPNDNYSPENCRWVTMKKQQNNKLNSFFITINNEKYTLAEWAEIKNLNKPTLYSKFYRLFESLGILSNDGIEINITYKK